MIPRPTTILTASGALAAAVLWARHRRRPARHTPGQILRQLLDDALVNHGPATDWTINFPPGGWA